MSLSVPVMTSSFFLHAICSQGVTEIKAQLVAYWCWSTNIWPCMWYVESQQDYIKMPVSISATHPLCILVSLTMLYRYIHVLLAWNSMTQHMQHVVGSRQHSLLLTGLVSLCCVVVTCTTPVLNALCCFSGSQSTSNDTCLAVMYVET